MPQSVKEAILEIIQKEGHHTEEQAQEFFHQMELTGRYASETWQ